MGQENDYYYNCQNNYNFYGDQQYPEQGYNGYEQQNQSQCQSQYYEEDCYNPRQYSNEYYQGGEYCYQEQQQNVEGYSYEYYEHSHNNSVVYEKCQGSSNEGSNSTMDEKA